MPSRAWRLEALRSIRASRVALPLYSNGQVPDDGALFRQVKGGAVGERLGVRSICRIITRRADDAGIVGRVSGHSLRVGSAQSLGAAEEGLVKLQNEGD